MSVLLRLLRLTSPFQRWIMLAVLLTFLTIASSIALMATSAYLISRAALVTDVASVAIAITCVRVFAMSRAGFRYLERLVSHRATLHILANLRSWFFASVEPLAPARLGTYRTGDLLTRTVADIETLESFYIRGVVPPIAAALVAVLACALLAWFALSLAAILLSALLFAGIALPLAMRRLAAASSRDVIDTRAEFQARLVDEIQGVADLLIFDSPGRHHAATLAVGRQLWGIQGRLGVLRGLSNALGASAVSFAALAILVVVIPLVNGGQIEGVYLALLVLAAIASFEAVQPLAPALQQLESTQQAGRRTFELIDAPVPVREPDSPAAIPQDCSLNVKGLSFCYDKSAGLVLDDVSFKVEQGRSLGIFGASGAGKSTIVNLLLRFWDYDRGEIKIGGQELRDCSSEDVRSRLAVMPQDVHLFNATLRENLLLARPEATDVEVETACKHAMLSNFIESLPAGLDTLIGENGLLLSGGERQRVGIARGILKDAPIMILDEPTANLDAVTEHELMESLRAVFRDRTVIIISHRAAALEHADQLVELVGGRLVERP